jgi:hypothetical protein
VALLREVLAVMEKLSQAERLGNEDRVQRYRARLDRVAARLADSVAGVEEAKEQLLSDVYAPPDELVDEAMRMLAGLSGEADDVRDDVVNSEPDGDPSDD